MGAITTGTALALAALSAGASYYNTTETAKDQDAAAAQSIRNQSAKQKEADARVDEQVRELEESTSADERTARLDDYMESLRTNQARTNSGLTGDIGGSAFKEDSVAAASGINDRAADLAGLMSRIDAPSLQRQGETFGYGDLATDIGIISRESQGQKFLDDLRLKSIQRNAGLDAASALLGGAATAGASGGTTDPAAYNMQMTQIKPDTTLYVPKYRYGG